MKIHYNILWVDDYPKDMKIQVERIERILKNNYYILCGHDKPFTSYEKFVAYLNERSENDFSSIDLILIDFNLSDNARKTGIDIIELLRSKNIYTDVIFYSGNMQDAIKQLKEHTAEFDNITYSDNIISVLIPKFEKVLRKQLNLIMQISDLRGYLMDATSDFDFITKSYVGKSFGSLAEQDQADVYKEIRQRIVAQKSLEKTKFSKIEKKPENADLVLAAMDSLEYVMTVKDKIYIMALIYQKLQNKSQDYAQIFTDLYDKQVIQYRNKLAHKKLAYGTKQPGHIKIISSKDAMDCNCLECDAKLTVEECEELRKKLFEYYSFFNNLL